MKIFTLNFKSVIRNFLIISLALFTFSCGYRMAGFDDSGSSKYTYYISEVINNHKESDYYNIMDDAIKSYFTRYNALSKKDDADFKLFFTLIKVKTSSAIKSSTEQTVYSDMDAYISIKAIDNSGKTVFKKTMTSSESYETGSNISSNIENRDIAFKTIINNILSDFKYEFENSR